MKHTLRVAEKTIKNIMKVRIELGDLATGTVMMVSDEQKSDFWEEGVICLRSVVSQEWLDRVAQGVNYVMHNPSKYGESLKAEGGTGSYFNDYCRWREVDHFKDFVYKSSAVQIVSEILDTKYVAFYHEHTLVKESGSNKKTPWHVDQSYYPIDGDQCCSIWMPLDPVPEESTIEFVAGSHLWKKKLRPRKFATSINYPLESDRTDQEYEDVPDIESENYAYKILKWAVQPGDVIVFHMKTLHGAPENTQPTNRRVFSTRWFGDDCVIGTRPWVTSPPSTGGQKFGDPAVCEEFPVIWPTHSVAD